MKKLVYLSVLFIGLVSLSTCGSKSLDEVLTGEWSYNFDLKSEDIDDEVEKGNLTFYNNGEVEIAPSDDTYYYKGSYKISDNTLTIEYEVNDTGLMIGRYYKIDVNEIKAESLTGSILSNRKINGNPYGTLEGNATLNKEK